MTLNLMLTSRYAVYLTGDFRLTLLNTGTFTDNWNTQKLIPVIRYRWGALVAYTGVASAPPIVHDTGNWVLAQMDTIPLHGSFNELSKRLLEADSWLSKIRGQVPLAFSIVGFVERRPFMMMISNFLDIDGNITPPRSKLSVFERRPKQPEVRVAGDFKAVVPEEKEHLKLLLQKNAHRQVIRETLAEVNIKAAQRSAGISQECVTGYLLPSGVAEIGPHGISNQEAYLPSFVIRDLVKSGVIGFKPKYDLHGKVIPPRWVGMTAKLQSERGREVIVVLHAVRNVGEPIGDGIERKDQTAFWKIAGSNEPDHYTFNIDNPPRKRK